MLNLIENQNKTKQMFIIRQCTIGAAQVVLVWLESIEDADSLPLAELVTAINSVCLVIFLHPLASGLVRVKLAGHVGK